MKLFILYLQGYVFDLIRYEIAAIHIFHMLGWMCSAGDVSSVDPDEIVTAVGARIRSLRKSGGLSLEALGALVDTPAAHLSGVERGIRNPSLKMLARIAAALEVDLLTLLDLRASKSAKELRGELQRRGKRLDDTGLRRVLGVLDVLK